MKQISTYINLIITICIFSVASFNELNATTIAQDQIVKGTVLDKRTGEPIPYVNISIEASASGTSSNTDGSYTLLVTATDFSKRIRCSSLGYQDYVIEVSKFVKLTRIYLTPKLEVLDPVLLSKKKEQLYFEINPVKKSNIFGGFGAGSKPWNIGLYFPFRSDYMKTRFLKSVKVCLNEGVFRNPRSSKFRIRFYKVAPNGLPGDDYIRRNIILDVAPDQAEVYIDLTQFDLIFPDNGLYIALEGLAIPYNAYEEETYEISANGKHQPVKVTRYAPSFATTSAFKYNHKVVFYEDGKWVNYELEAPEENKMFVPAISLTLSN